MMNYEWKSLQEKQTLRRLQRISYRNTKNIVTKLLGSGFSLVKNHAFVICHAIEGGM